MKKIWRILIAAVAVLVFDGIFGWLSCGWLFSWVYEIEPTNIWKPMTEGPAPSFFVVALVLNLVLVLVYALIKKGLPGKNILLKGLIFGLIVWAVGMLEGMAAMYFFTVTAPTVLIYWTILGLIQYPLRGLIIAAIYGK